MSQFTLNHNVAFHLSNLQLMEPVRTLRRNCSILHASDKDGQTIVMRPQQMLQYLFSTNESEANFELKTIGKKLKSFLQLSLGDHPMRAVVSMKALNIFKNVLDWAKKYEDEPTMYVWCSVNHLKFPDFNFIFHVLSIGLIRCYKCKRSKM